MENKDMKNSNLNFATKNAALVLFASSPLNAGSVLDNSPSAQPRQETIYSFSGPPDGHLPLGGVVKDPAGNLYGTLFSGGVHGAGAVFELSRQPNGTWSETVIYSFHSQNDGKRPVAGLVLDAAGNLYGTTETGGAGQCFTETARGLWPH